MIIRDFRTRDALDVSKLICTTLREVNSKDYAPAIINFMCENYSPENILEMAKKRTIIVAVDTSTIVGTASLENNYIGSVFVRPSFHRQGLGTRLMNAVEEIARQKGIKAVCLGASITAVEFYDKRGYQRVKEFTHPQFGRIIEMTINL